MKTTATLLAALLLTVVTTMQATCDGQDYALQAIKITANAPVDAKKTAIIISTEQRLLIRYSPGDFRNSTILSRLPLSVRFVKSYHIIGPSRLPRFPSLTDVIAPTSLALYVKKPPDQFLA